MRPLAVKEQYCCSLEIPALLQLLVWSQLFLSL